MTLAPDKQKHIVFCVAFAAFTFQFEAFLVNVSLPVIAKDFATTLSYISFVVIGYLLAATLSFVPAANFAQRYGLKRIFLVGCALACIGTLMSSLSFNLWLLLGSRLIQGAGSGVIVSIGYAMIPAWISHARRGWGYGLLSMGAGIGMVAGLPLGGILSYFISWHWVFAASLPVLVGLFCYAWSALPEDAHLACATPLAAPKDQPGSLLFFLLLVSLIFSLSLGTELGWDSYPILSGLLLAIIALMTMIVRARLIQHTRSSIELIRTPGFMIGLSVLFLFSAIVGGVRFLFPFYLDQSVGLNTLMSSYVLLIYPIVLAPTAAWAGTAADQIGSRMMVLAACVLGLLVCSVLANLLWISALWPALLFLMIFGLATGMFYAPNNRFVMTHVREDQSLEAAAFVPLLLNVGSIFGMSVFDTVFGMDVREIAHASSAQVNLGFYHALVLAAALLIILVVLVYFKYKPPSCTILDHQD